MSRARTGLILLVAVVVAATVWLGVAWSRAGRVPAGPGGRERIVVPAAQRRDRLRAAANYAGVVSATAGVVALSRLRRRPSQDES